MKTLAALLLIVTFSTVGFAQGDAIEIGKKITIESSLLQEERSIWVGLPDGYSEENKYPVFYLLDGNGHFQHTTGSAKFLQSNDKAPGIIIVGILNTNRTRDLTPPAIATTVDDSDQFDYTQGGGADNFLAFIETELMPYIESNYSTANYKGLIGHSFGGLFAVHSLLSKPTLFDAYISISPSLWYDQQSFLPAAEKVLTANKDLTTSYYMTMGDEGGDMLGGAMKLAALMEENSKSMHWQFTPMPKETHGTVPHRSTYDGLEFIFSDWQPDMPKSLEEFQAAMASEGISGMIGKWQKHYAGLSEKYGFEVTEEPVVNRLGYVLMQEKMYDEAINAMKSNTTRFPNSPNAFDSLGDVYKASGDIDSARKSYARAVELAEQYHHPVGEYSKQKLEELENN